MNQGTGAPRERLDVVRARYREQALHRGISPRDVDLLISDIIGKPQSFLIAHGDILIETTSLNLLLQRRFAGEPLQYIRRRTEFFSRELYVDDRVLIPRPETEILVEAVMERAPPGGRVVDVGTGSGCIAISLALERSDLRVVGLDRSFDALAVARRNRKALSAPVGLAVSDLLEGVDCEIDLIVSNPPYIAASEVEQLATEVRDHEPRMALTPGPRGTEIIERLMEQARGTKLMMEIGFGQEPAIRELALARGYEVETIIPDLAGIPRVVVLSGHGWK